MNRQSLIQSFRRALTAAAATLVICTFATAGPAEEAASIANPAAIGPAASISNPAATPTPIPPPPPANRIINRRGATKITGPASPLPPATFNLPSDYSILNKRSFFSRNGVAASATPTGPGKPEETLAVRGIVSDDQTFLIFIEDTLAHRTLQLREGDPVAGGKVGQVCMDDFAFEASGTSKHIRVGQNLLGAPVPPITPAPPQPAPNANQPPNPQQPPKNAKPQKPPENTPNGPPVRNLVAERAG